MYYYMHWYTIKQMPNLKFSTPLHMVIACTNLISKVIIQHRTWFQCNRRQTGACRDSFVRCTHNHL